MVSTRIRVTLRDGAVWEEYVSDEEAKRLYTWQGRDDIRLSRVMLVAGSVATIEVREPASDEWHLAWKRR